MKKSYKRSLILLLAFALVFSLASCSGGEPSGSSAASSAAAPADSAASSEAPADSAGGGDVFKLGSLMSTSGTLALLCQAESYGIHMAVEEINATGGLDIGGTKIPVELIEYDVGTDPVSQIDYAQRLVNVDGVKLMNGLLNSGTMINQLEVTTPAEVIVYNSVGSVACLAGSGFGVNCSDTGVLEGHSLMEVFGEDDATLEAAGFDVERVRSIKRVAVFGMNEAYSQLNTAGIKDGCEKHGLEFAGSVLFQPGTTDFLSYINQLKALEPDAVYLCTYSDDTMIPPLRDMLQVGGLDFTTGEITILGNDVMVTDAFIQSAAAQGIAIDGAICFAKLPGELPPAYVSWAEKALEIYGQDFASLVGYIADGYDSTMCMLRAVENAGTTTDTKAIMEAVNNTPYESLLGQWNFTNGQLAQAEHIKIIKDGKVVETGVSYMEELSYGAAVMPYEEALAFGSAA